MIRFIAKTLIAVPVWLVYLALMTPLIVLGFPLVFVLAWWVQLKSKYWSISRTGALHFPWWAWLWDNAEDGVDGDPITEVGCEPKNPEWFWATSTWTVWRRVFVWSAWRNSVGNARRIPFFGMTVYPKKVAIIFPDNTLRRRDYLPWADFDSWWNEYRKLGPYLARQGYRFELRFPWGNKRFFWIGWRIVQQDRVTKNVGFAFQPFGKL